MKKSAHLICLIIFPVLFWSFTLVPLNAQQQRQESWWLTLEEGKRHFRNGAYGQALRSFENARQNRKNYYAKLEQDLITVLSLHEVRRLNDALDHLEVYIEKEFRTVAKDALNELYYRVPKDSLNNSSKAALSAMGRLKNYPEAEYWIGEVYRMEGEYRLALDQYQKAYEQRALLEQPEFGTEILYKIADTRRLRREYVEMIKTLEGILKADKLWSSESFNRSNMLRSLETNGVTRFLLLFRHNEPSMEKAHRSLGFYYYSDSSRHDRAADHLLFAFLIQNSVLIEAMLRSQYNYSFTGLAALMEDIAKRRDLLAYVNETEYYKTLYYLANSLYFMSNSRRNSSREIWTFLRDHAKGEWQTKAASQLRSPQSDPLPIPPANPRSIPPAL